MSSFGAPLDVKTLQVYKLWENQEGTRSTRATIAIINGFSRVTLGKYFLIKDSEEAKKFKLPANQWLPEKKGKHLCLAPCELSGLGQRLSQIVASIEEASVLATSTSSATSAGASRSANVDVQRLGFPGPGSSNKGALWAANTFAAAGNVAPAAANAATIKKRGPKSKCKTQAYEEQDENGYVREDDEDSGIDMSKPRRYVSNA